MKRSSKEIFQLLVVACIITTAAAFAQAQTSNVAAQRAATLRAQLADAQAKETELQARLKQLDEQLLPQNIELSQAANGSTHPEDVREQRRRQLENEKARVQSQLAQLAATRTRLEAAISTADADAYRQSANTGGASNATPLPSAAGTTATAPTNLPDAETPPSVDPSINQPPTQPRSTARRSRRSSRQRRVRRPARAH